ncbi:MAG: squalene/phytoene synthase family protein [Chloroflexi bacterium]|nr:squalene/phytoene synthase family protein [Chloroflexota bacterium]
MISTYPQTWERDLLSLACRGGVTPPPATRTIADTNLLARAYAHCEAIAATYSRSFYLATGLLPSDKRRAIRALYAFCRVTDNIVDCPDGDAKRALARWRRKSLTSEPTLDDPVAVAWGDTRRRYRIPPRYAEQLIEGVARDLRQNRYRTFEDIAAYAYGVASTVGLMSMHVIGFSGAEAIPYAIKLGVALQMTNILRDVAEDWRMGRVYLPTEELAAYGLDESDIAAGRVDERWRAFMRFQIARNRRLYAEAWRGIAMLNPDGRFAVAAAGELYRAILDDIESHDYDVFTRRAHVSAARKLGRLPGIWWRNR